VQVRLLGPLEVVGPSGPITIGGPKERAVLAALALRPGEAVSEDALVDALWSGVPPPTAVKTLHAYGSRLRKLLADGGADGEVAIETTAGGYTLRLRAGGRDVDEVFALLDSARSAAAAGDAAWAALAFGRALQAWRGRPLGEFADEPFARAEAARLEELRQLVVEERIDAELACGHHSTLLGELEALTGSYPLRERLWAQRMTALYRAGRQGDALQVYQQLRTLLGEELGVDPSPALVQLHARILKQDPGLDWVPAAQSEATSAQAAELPSGVVTFLLTDVEGSTALWETHAAGMRAALARHDDILTTAIREHDGTLVKPKGEGDSTFAVFSSASDAVRAALAAQRAFAAEQWPEHAAIRVRMAIHTGEAELRDGDYFGSTVNRAARLRELAHGGQAVLSQAAADVLGDVLPDGAGLVDLGEHRLRDLSRPERVFQLMHPTLRAHFPPLRAHSGDATNLPAQTTSFVGRELQLADVASALETARVVTLTGVGGVGKTRLALEVAVRTLPLHRDGVWLVEFAPTVDPAAIVEVVASALGVVQKQGQTLAASVLDFLRAKRLLLVLDNCEHLLDPVARWVDEIVHSCAQVGVLATSREGLGVRGERIIAVPSLELPAQQADHDGAADAEAVRLFVTRAVDAKADFALTEKNQAAVCHLCRRLDGIPLAIELAAARVRSLTPADLAARLDERFRLLAGGPRTAVERHQTLRRAIDWSYDLLAELEQRALNRLAVFAGSFDLDAAEAVITSDDIAINDVADLLGRLVDKSLLVVDDQQDDTRYRLLETIRSYAQDRLEMSGELELLRRRHAEYYVAFAARAGEGLRGPDEVAWVPRVDAELDNLRAIVGWSVATGDADLALRLIAPLTLATGTHIGYASAPWAESVVGLPGAPTHPLYPEVLAWAGYAVAIAGDAERGARLTAEARDRAAAMSVPIRSMIKVLTQSTMVAMWCGQIDELVRLAARWLELARVSGDDLYLGGAMNMMGTAQLLSGEVDGARDQFDAAVAVARRLRNPSVLAHAANMAGECRIETEPDRARALLDEALDAATSVDNRLAMSIAITFSIYLHLAEDEWREAAQRVLFASEYMHRAGDSNAFRGMCLPGAITVLAKVRADETAAHLIGVARTESVSDQVKKQFDEAVATLRSRLGPERFAEYAALGAGMDDDEIFTLVQTQIEACLAEHPS
jgi:predicted ATPase/DNA-binding SARP family transcriptional activator